jgi:hypothetical protein
MQEMHTSAQPTQIAPNGGESGSMVSGTRTPAGSFWRGEYRPANAKQKHRTQQKYQFLRESGMEMEEAKQQRVGHPVGARLAFHGIPSRLEVWGRQKTVSRLARSQSGSLPNTEKPSQTNKKNREKYHEKSF